MWWKWEKDVVLPWLKLLVGTLTLIPVLGEECSRRRSRVVREVITEGLTPIFNELSETMSLSCPLSNQRDMYANQEAHKYSESASKWVCQFCGKAFYEERFLDQHYDNRHPDTLGRGPESVCLADYCDVFRCDVLEGKKRAGYWDMALCKESDLHNTVHRCERLLLDCLPSPLPVETRLKLYERLNKTLCGNLNCDKYWDLPHEQVDPVSAAMYIMLFVLLAVGLMIYYYVAYTHFYTEESLLHQEQRSRLDEQPYHMFTSAPQGQDIRYRTGAR